MIKVISEKREDEGSDRMRKEAEEVVRKQPLHNLRDREEKQESVLFNRTNQPCQAANI
jgi:hypothetical protein